MMQTIEQINNRNKEFWLEQSKVTLDRICDEPLFTVATANMNSEVIKGVPLKLQTSIDQALEDAEKARRIFQISFSRKGGRASMCDALQTLIEQIARENRKIDARALAIALKGDRGAGTVTSIDMEADVMAGEPKMIHFVGDDEKPRRAPLSGLKDRLYRARKKIKSR
jgi:hypothetical protein